MHRFFLTPLCLLGLAGLLACGGNAKSPTNSPTTPTTSGTGVTNPVNSPAVLNTSAGQTAGGVDITVVPPGGSPPPNAQDLGVAALTGSATAYNTGNVIHRGATMRVVLFGPGLSGNMRVTIRGPNDIQVSNITGTTATDNTAGISFVATVSSSAALGARTVVLQTPQGDVTTFTGGLEVVP